METELNQKIATLFAEKLAAEKTCACLNSTINDLRKEKQSLMLEQQRLRQQISQEQRLRETAEIEFQKERVMHRMEHEHFEEAKHRWTYENNTTPIATPHTFPVHETSSRQHSDENFHQETDSSAPKARLTRRRSSESIHYPSSPAKRRLQWINRKNESKDDLELRKSRASKLRSTWTGRLPRRRTNEKTNHPKDTTGLSHIRRGRAEEILEQLDNTGFDWEKESPPRPRAFSSAPNSATSVPATPSDPTVNSIFSLPKMKSDTCIGTNVFAECAQRYLDQDHHLVHLDEDS